MREQYFVIEDLSRLYYLFMHSGTSLPKLNSKQ